MKPRSLKRNLALLSTFIACGAALPAAGQSMFDVFFLSDTTGSMGGLINGVKSSSNLIVEQFLATGADVRFGVGEYKDGNADAFAFRYNLTTEGIPTFSTDSALVSSAIAQWGASGGGDFPEDNLLALREVADTAPWRDGARRIVYWFGDAPSLDPGSDGTTLSSALAALSANCVEVIAIDVSGDGGLDDGTGQVEAITTAILDCGRDGGQMIDLDISGLTPEEAAALILATLTDSFTDLTGGGDNNSVIASGNLGASLALNRAVTRDVGGRLFRMRAGMQEAQIVVTQAPPPATTGKGGMAPAAVSTSYAPQWEIWGQLFYSDDTQDAQYQGIPGGRRLIRGKTESEIFGGTIGIERRLAGPWSAGFGISLAEADVTMRNVASTDIDSVAFIPYVSYYKANAMHGADLYADALYAYTDSDYSIRRSTGASGSTDGSSHQIELNAGLNYRRGNALHGPFAQFRWLDGEIDRHSLGAVNHAATDYESVATQLGYQVSFPIRVQGGVVVPQLTAAWEHEFESSLGSFGGIPLGEVDEDLAVLGAGVGFYLTTGWNMQLQYQARLGSDTENHYVGLKVGKEF